MKCQRCGDDIPEDDIYNHRGKILCEDCYVGALQPPKPCDVTAVHSATKHRELAGLKGAEGLTELQQKIYTAVTTSGQKSRLELMQEFQLPEWELEKQLAVLRHCELLKGRKIGDQVYTVPFDA